MKQYRPYLAVAVVIAAFVVGAIAWVDSSRYYPLVRVVLHDQAELIFIDMPWTDLKSCQQANQKIISAISSNCKLCQTIDSCSEKVDASLLKALLGQPINNFVVHSGSLRIVIKDGAASNETCKAMAVQISHDKKQAARCVTLNVDA